MHCKLNMQHTFTVPGDDLIKPGVKSIKLPSLRGYIPLLGGPIGWELVKGCKELQTIIVLL